MKNYTVHHHHTGRRNFLYSNSMADVPIIDLAEYNIHVPVDNADKDAIKGIGKEIVAAIQDVGGLYLTNYGIPDEQVKGVMAESNKFFSLPTSVKKKYAFRRTDHTGWAGLEAETMEDDQPPNLNENFHMEQIHDTFPTIEEQPHFIPGLTKLFEDCQNLATRFLRLLALGLDMDDEDVFVKMHNPKDKHISTIKSIFYPDINTIKAATSLKLGAMRFVEHTDFGTFTQVFQDETGGLEVLTTDGNWTPLKPTPDTIGINIGDLVERWTSGRLKPTLHRVVLPEGKGSKMTRNSIAYFTHPAAECIVKCLDGSDKFEPVSALGYVQKRWDSMYAK